MDLCESEASLVYTVNFRTVQGYIGRPIFKKSEQKATTKQKLHMGLIQYTELVSSLNPPVFV